MDYTKIIKHLQLFINSRLKPRRISHINNVVSTAKKINKKYNKNIPEDKIIVAGLAHDMFKFIKKDKLTEEIKKCRVKLDVYEKNNLSLYHGPIAADYLKNKLKLKDKSIIEAVRYHSRGTHKMSILSKILYAADYIEPSRKHKKEFKSRDLNSLLLQILDSKLSYLISKKRVIHPATFFMRNELLEKIQRNMNE